MIYGCTQYGITTIALDIPKLHTPKNVDQIKTMTHAHPSTIITNSRDLIFFYQCLIIICSSLEAVNTHIKLNKTSPNHKHLKRYETLFPQCIILMDM